MAMKMSDFIIGMLLISTIVAILALFMSNMNANYSVTYDNTSLATYNQLSELENLTKSIEKNESGIMGTGSNDILGDYFTSGYKVMKLTKASYSTFNKMSDKAVDDARLGAAGQYLKIFISSTILIIIVLAIIVKALVKSDV